MSGLPICSDVMKDTTVSNENDMRINLASLTELSSFLTQDFADGFGTSFDGIAVG